MVVYVQKQNRNSFTLRFKRYKMLRYDLWGRISWANRRNNITHYLKYFAAKDTFSRLKILKKKKRRKLRRFLKLSRKYKPRLYETNKNKFYIGKMSGNRTGRPKEAKLKRRSAVRNLKHTFRFFYGLSFRRKSLRKFFTIKSSQPSVALELRIDTLLYRSNFFQTVAEARKFVNFIRLLKNKKISKFICLPNKLKANTQILPYQILVMTPTLTLKRKSVLLNYLRATNKIYNCRYSHILINFRLLAVALLRIPNATEIRFPFSNIPLLRFLGVARYL